MLTGDNIVEELKVATLEEIEEYCMSRFSPEDYPEMTFIDHLGYGERWVVIRQIAEGKLPKWSRYQEEAKSQWRTRCDRIKWIGENDQRKEGLHPKIKELHAIADTIWWICNIFYPYTSRNCDVDPCLCITGDGMGMAYFQVDGLDTEDATFTLLKCDDPYLSPVFEKMGIYPRIATDFDTLRRAWGLFAGIVKVKFDSIQR